MDIEEIVRELEALAPDKRREVYDFIAFLRSRSIDVPIQKVGRKRKLCEEPFIGLWKDREDMKDSASWVRRTRKSEWMN